MTTATPEHFLPPLDRLGPEWRYAGSVAVDSGSVLVIDAMGTTPETWALDQARARCAFGPLPLSPEHLHRAVHCASGLGDGFYPVLARVVELPDWGERVAELRVIFIDEEAA
jgi:hypothetical protein